MMKFLKEFKFFLLGVYRFLFYRYNYLKIELVYFSK